MKKVTFIKKNLRRKGFTLIELMIVVAIIGILAAIAVPNFNRARTQAKIKACVSNMKTLEGALELYMMEKRVAADTEVGQTELEDGGYVRSWPQCPDAGDYTFTVAESGKYKYFACSVDEHTDAYLNPYGEE